MSNSPHNTGSAPNREHGTMQSYVIGFVLSLVFTFIPYYLVVNHKLTGNTLLATIIGFGVLQMVIQVTFFLHLGRGPKPKWNLFFFISTIGIILIVVGGSIMIINNLHYNMLPSDQTKKLTNDEGIYQIGGQKTGACQGQYANHIVTIKNNLVSPLHTQANRCDTLTFVNEDNESRGIVFGTYPKNVAYAGETNLIVRIRQNQTITLSESGTYQFHDNLQAVIAGDFTVTQ